jgi:hypothetical protein
MQNLRERAGDQECAPVDVLSVSLVGNRPAISEVSRAARARVRRLRRNSKLKTQNSKKDLGGTGEFLSFDF